MKKAVLLLAILMMTACVTAPENLIVKNGYAVDTTHTSPNQNERIRF